MGVKPTKKPLNGMINKSYLNKLSIKAKKGFNGESIHLYFSLIIRPQSDLLLIVL